MKIKIDRVLIFSIIIYLSICLVDAIIFLHNTAINSPEEYTAYSFWQKSRYGTFNISIAFCMPALIATGSVYRFHQKIKTGFFKNVLTRENYEKFIFIEFIKSHLKSYFIIPLCSIIILLIGCLLYGVDGPKGNVEGTLNAYFSFFNITENYFGFALKLILVTLIYSSFVVNIAWILTRYIKKFYLVICSLIGVIFVSDFVVMAFLKNTSIVTLYSLDNINLIKNTIFPCIIMILISNIIIFLIYRNKEKVVLESDK